MKKILSNILVFALILTLVQIPCFSVMAASGFVANSEITAEVYNRTESKTEINNGLIMISNKGTYRELRVTIDISDLAGKNITDASVVLNFITGSPASTSTHNIYFYDADDTTKVIGTETGSFAKIENFFDTGGEKMTISLTSVIDKAVDAGKDEFVFIVAASPVSADDSAAQCGVYSPKHASNLMTLNYEYEVDAATLPYAVTTPVISDDGKSATVDVTVNDAGAAANLKAYLVAYADEGGCVVIRGIDVVDVSAGGTFDLSIAPEGVVDQTKAFVWDGLTPVVHASK